MQQGAKTLILSLNFDAFLPVWAFIQKPDRERFVASSYTFLVVCRLNPELAQSRDGLAVPKGLKGAEVVQQRLDQMGEMAPYGSKAVLVADRLMRDGDVESLEGQRYAFKRQKDGAITITDRQTKAPLFQMDRNGAIQASEAALSPQNRQNFNGMFDKLAAAQPVKVAAAVKNVSSLEIGER